MARISPESAEGVAEVAGEMAGEWPFSGQSVPEIRERSGKSQSISCKMTEKNTKKSAENGEVSGKWPMDDESGQK